MLTYSRHILGVDGNGPRCRMQAVVSCVRGFSLGVRRHVPTFTPPMPCNTSCFVCHTHSEFHALTTVLTPAHTRAAPAATHKPSVTYWLDHLQTWLLAPQAMHGLRSEAGAHIRKHGRVHAAERSILPRQVRCRVGRRAGLFRHTACQGCPHS